ncbi:hypothetical protein TNCV_4669371 [Trichonephila clavipes]|nr:hypothetical protein TNCV_4669371 [Trichonephila clavipes]
MVFTSILLALKTGAFQWRFQFRKQPEVTRNHVLKVGRLGNNWNSMFRQKDGFFLFCRLRLDQILKRLCLCSNHHAKLTKPETSSEISHMVKRQPPLAIFFALLITACISRDSSPSPLKDWLHSTDMRPFFLSVEPLHLYTTYSSGSLTVVRGPMGVCEGLSFDVKIFFF